MPKAPPIHRPFGKKAAVHRPRKDDAGAKLTRRVHNSSRWRYHVQPAQLRAYPLCALCEAEGRLEAAVHVDHIRPIRDGGAPFDPANLRSLCKPHHSAVTRAWQNQRDHGDEPAPPAPTYTVA
jgi:5-methylcytosine-specific restriction protein A